MTLCGLREASEKWKFVKNMGRNFDELWQFSNLSKTLFGLSGNLTQWNLSQDGDLLEFESISYFDLIWNFWV